MSADDAAPVATDMNRGPIAWMAKNSVAANLLMFVILVGGAIGILRTKQEVFPEFTIDIVQVAVPYPGASPAETEQGIVLAVEEAVRGLDGVKRVTSSSTEGAGAVSVELVLGADSMQVLGDVKDAVDRIVTFPEDAEEPTVSLLSRKREVISVAIAGEVPLRRLHTLAEELRARFLDSPGITQVEIGGVPPVEIAIELERATLESYGWTPDDVAAQIRFASLELPAGEVESSAGEFLLRVADRKRTAADYAEIVLKTTRSGAQVRLGDVAEITDTYEDVDLNYLYNGRPAVRVVAYRTGDETPASVASAAKALLPEFRAELPDSIDVEVWKDDSIILQERIELLYRNALMGLILVLIILALFLNLRLAFWVALGIPISFMGAFLLMPAADKSINMVSLFAFIVTLGMVVDDAIIVGEHAYKKMQDGMSPMKAAITGAQEMAVPVTFAVLTTVAAFSPLFFVPGFSGKIFSIIPAVVVAVLVFSVIESFFVLPAHVAHIDSPGIVNWFLEPFRRVLGPIQGVTTAALQRFIANVYQPIVRVAVKFRYVTLAVAFASLVVAVATVAAGLVPFNFFPKLEGDKVTASVTLPYGASSAVAREAQLALEASAQRTADALGREKVKGMFTRVGEGAATGGPGGGAGVRGSHLVTVEMSLVASGEREFSAEDFSNRWKKETPPLVGLESLVFNSSTGPGAGQPVSVQLIHRDTAVLAAASRQLFEELNTFSQLTDVENSYASGKPQLSYHLRADAHNLGLTSQMVARQLRSFVYGAQAVREQRGRDEVKVMVRLPETERSGEEDLLRLRIRTPRGGLVPLAQVVELERGRAPTTIKREDGKRVVTVSAGLAAGVPSPQPVLDALKTETLPQLKKKYPGLKTQFTGAQREQAETMKSLGQNFLFALFVIFALLAIPFRSYVQPFIVMAAIPFGFVGAVAGHIIMGFELSVISIMGVIALAGVVVNDSLVLIDATNRYRAEGMSATEAVIAGGMRRFRPIMLTSLTTFFGLMPMIFETSMQARFLIPMAISLGFGVLFATFIALIVVPSLYLIVEDIVGLFRGRPAAAESDGDPAHPISSTAQVRP